ncbi:MAG: hypothetical protein WC522_03845 [Candidatus Omnitrophota bacterium]
MKLTDRLIEAMRSEFGKSKRWYHRSICASLGMLLLSVILVPCSSGISAVILGMGLFILPMLLFVSREFSLEHQDRAEYIRRSLMLADALDHKPSKIELAQLKIDVGSIDRSEPLFDKRYYDSKIAVGPSRLIDILAESAFFTHNLSKRVAYILGGIICVGVVGLFFVLYMLLSIPVGHEISLVVAKWAALVMSFLAAGDFSYLFRRSFCLSIASKNVLSKSDVFIKNGNISAEDAMELADEYNCAVIQSPPIPGAIYKYMLKSLNEAWRKRQS